ncbi:MAG: hypothetical protein V4497_08485 [Bacteroidota bacterium]
MNQSKFPIVIYQKPTILEGFFTVIILAITFCPFIYGIKTAQPKYCLSIILGFICFKLFNQITGNKFTHSKIIQKTKSISFSEISINFFENQNIMIYNWSDLEEIEIKIFAYGGRHYLNDYLCTGIENYIQFIQNGKKIKYRFYIENVSQFNLLKEQFNDIILPELKEFDNINEENYINTQIYFKRLNSSEI